MPHQLLYGTLNFIKIKEELVHVLKDGFLPLVLNSKDNSQDLRPVRNPDLNKEYQKSLL